MKKPFSITNAALNVIRVCLAAGIFISLFCYFSRADRSNPIVINFPSASETEETSAPDISSTLEVPHTYTVIHTEISTDTEPLSAEPEQTFSHSSNDYQDETTTEEEPEIIETAPDYIISPPTIAQTAPSSEYASPPSVRVESTAELININEASVNELVRLSGIGEVKAAAIVEYRRTNGSFSAIEDIMKVKGIGEKTFEKIRDQISV